MRISHIGIASILLFFFIEKFSSAHRIARSRSFNKIKRYALNIVKVLTCALYAIRSLRVQKSFAVQAKHNQNMSDSLLDICRLFFVMPTTCGSHAVSLFTRLLSLTPPVSDSLSLYHSRALILLRSSFFVLSFSLSLQ